MRKGKRFSAVLTKTSKFAGKCAVLENSQGHLLKPLTSSKVLDMIDGSHKLYKATIQTLVGSITIENLGMH